MNLTTTGAYIDSSGIVQDSGKPVVLYTLVVMHGMAGSVKLRSGSLITDPLKFQVDTIANAEPSIIHFPQGMYFGAGLYIELTNATVSVCYE